MNNRFNLHMLYILLIYLIQKVGGMLLAYISHGKITNRIISFKNFKVTFLWNEMTIILASISYFQPFYCSTLPAEFKAYYSRNCILPFVSC